MRRLADDWGGIRLDRPFAMWFEPADDVPGTWIARITGHELDNITQGDGPLGAVSMALDLLKMLTGVCSLEDPKHDWSVRGGLKRWVGPGDDDMEEVPSWTCSKCGESANLRCFVEDEPDLQP